MAGDLPMQAAPYGSGGGAGCLGGAQAGQQGGRGGAQAGGAELDARPWLAAPALGSGGGRRRRRYGRSPTGRSAEAAQGGYGFTGRRGWEERELG
jgi:hypothetical protein